MTAHIVQQNKTSRMMGGDSEFGRLIQQAAKLKGHMMSQDRQRYETWPKYLQHTMYVQEKLQETRDLPVRERLAQAEEWKQAGNELLKQQNFDAAMNTYEKALGVWRYVYNRETDWKKKGIKDEDVKIVDDSGEEVEKQVADFKLSVLLNISLAAQRMCDFHLSARACTDALELDESNTKALSVPCLRLRALLRLMLGRRRYRRAGAYAAMGSATEFDMAIADLRRA